MIPWNYNGIEVKEVPEGMQSFVYYLELEFEGTTYKYIGKKNFFSTRRTKVPDKVRRKVITKESDWRLYCSSSYSVKALLKDGAIITKRDIWYICETLTCATYMETKSHFDHNVLCSEEYLNKAIACKIMRCHIIKEKE